MCMAFPFWNAKGSAGNVVLGSVGTASAAPTEPRFIRQRLPESLLRQDFQRGGVSHAALAALQRTLVVVDDGVHPPHSRRRPGEGDAALVVGRQGLFELLVTVATAARHDRDFEARS